ncbi:LysE family translocator [Bradyrhizobium sp. HKCCYLS3077]|uniref:LysE family translocator n=1 Tax=Bradyrhizobium sp. HKCCYLS3077 TaxID=3420761 RepID=UPI003EBAE43F
MSQAIAALLSGVGVGLSVAAPIGPMGVLCIQRTLSCGAATGVATGLGAATVHLVYSAFAVFGLGTLAQPWLESHSLLLGCCSGLILLWFALRLYRRTVVLSASGDTARIHPAHAFFSAIGLGAANPLTIVLFLAMLHALAGQSAAPLLIAGVFAGSVAWWLVLSATVALIRQRVDAGVMAWSSKLASLILLALGVTTLLRMAVRVMA